MNKLISQPINRVTIPIPHDIYLWLKSNPNKSMSEQIVEYLQNAKNTGTSNPQR